MTETIGFIGLGALGTPIAGNLLDAGYDLRVHNRTTAKMEPLIVRGAGRAARAVDAVSPGGIVMTLLWDDASVDEVVGRDGFLERLGPGGVHVSMSTISPEGSKRLATRHAEHGAAFVEAPIFGRPDAAVAKGLWVPMAGPAAAKARVKPVLEAMGAKGVYDFGEAIGAATTVKLAGNYLIISAGRSILESMSMVRANGYDAAPVIDMLTETLFPAPVYQGIARIIAGGLTDMPPGLSDIPLKDMGLFKGAAERAGSPTVMADALLGMLRRAG